MTAEANRAIAVIRRCVEDDRFAMALYFEERMEQRGLFWGDVQAVIDGPDNVRSQGMDRYDRPKWIISGRTPIGSGIEIVCAVEIDETGTEFITLYWDN